MVPTSADDWNALWEEKQAKKGDDHGEKHWDERSKTFTNKDTPGSYTDKFLELAGVQEGESVLDMGCGTGNLAIPLAQSGHHVLACDFSEGMLSKLDQKIECDGLHNIDVKKLSWDDDWEAHGLTPGVVDIGFASRSIITDDLKSALMKLSCASKRKCCITMATGISPRLDERMLKFLGIPAAPSLDVVYAIAILSAESFLPHLTYIRSERNDTYENFDAAYDKYSHMLKSVLGSEDANIGQFEEKLKIWLNENLVHANEQDSPDALTLRQPREVNWAFVSWASTR